MKSLKIIFIYLALTISVLLVFWQVRNFDFVKFDDPVYVYENQHVTSGLTKDGIISAFTTAPAGGNWLPLTWLSLMLDCQLFGLNPGRMHMVNVFLHLVNTLLLFAVFKKMTGALWPSAFVAAAFALHPMHVESVAWITERKDVLSAFFLLLTIAAYAGYVKRPSVFRYAAVLLLFALGLMAKPMLVTLPFVLLLLDYWPLNRFENTQIIKKSSQSALTTNKRSILYRLIMEKVPFAAFSVVSSVITFLVQRSGGAMVDIDLFSLESRFANALLSYGRYIGKMFWPEDLAVFYPYAADGIPLGQLTLCVLLLLGVTLLVLFWGRSRKYLPVGWFWFIGTLIPVIGLVQVGSQAFADRYTYIPYIGLFMMMAWGLPDILSKWPYRRAVLGVLMVGVLTAGGLCAYRQTGYWKDSIALFSRAVQATQNNYSMLNNLGVAYDALGRHEEAIAAYQQVVQIKPNNYNLGLAYIGLGRYDQAVEFYQQSLRIKPNHAKSYTNLGAAYNRLGRHQEAIEVCQQSIRIKPNDAGAYNNLGVAYFALGRRQEAIEAYRQAIRLKPDDADAYNSLATAYYALGRYQEATEAYQQVIQIKPDDYNLGMAYIGLGRYPEAVEIYQRVVRIKPNDAKVYYNLGLAYICLGRYTQAIEAYQQAIRVNPNEAKSHTNLGAAYSGLGRYAQAIGAYQQAIRIDPNDDKTYYGLGVLYFGLGRYEEAAQAFGQTIRIRPQHADAYKNLGQAYSALGRHTEAIEAYQQTIRIRPNDARLHNSLGAAYYALGRYPDAAEAFGQAIQVWPQYADAYNNLGEAYVALARYPEAIAAYQQAVRIKPEHADAHLSLGLAYLKIGDKAAATKEYEILKALDIEKARQISRKLKLDQDGQTGR